MNRCFRWVLLASAVAALLGVTGCDSATTAGPSASSPSTASKTAPATRQPTEPSEDNQARLDDRALQPAPSARSSEENLEPSEENREPSEENREPSEENREPSEENQVLLGVSFGPPGPAPFDFGAVSEGGRKLMSIRLLNGQFSENDHRIESVSVTTTDPVGGSDFQLASNGCVEILKPGDSCVVKVFFKPTGPGTRSGRLRIEATTVADVPPLTGEGVGSAQLTESAEPSDTESTDEAVEPADPSESAEPSETTEPSGPTPEATAE